MQIVVLLNIHCSSEGEHSINFNLHFDAGMIRKHIQLRISWQYTCIPDGPYKQGVGSVANGTGGDELSANVFLASHSCCFPFSQSLMVNFLNNETLLLVGFSVCLLRNYTWSRNTISQLKYDALIAVKDAVINNLCSWVSLMYALTV